jgi:peptidylprolyl isomerase
MSIGKGDFLLVDYTGSVKETGEVFDTTLENVAKEKGLYKTGDIYEPKLIVTGEGWVLKALDESLLTLEVGKTALVEIPPDKAFGDRDPEKVKLVSLRRLSARGITPRLGMRLEMDGKPATVRTMGSGRVQLDFNPPLAGKTLVYEVTIRIKLVERAEKIEALIHRRIPSVDIKKFNLKSSEKWVEIEVPEEAFYIEGLQLAKRGIAMDIQRILPEIIMLRFVETFKKEKTASEEKRE